MDWRKHWHRAYINRHLHRVHHLSHLAYLGLVAVEGHGYYAYAAVVMGVCVVVLWINKGFDGGNE